MSPYNRIKLKKGKKKAKRLPEHRPHVSKLKRRLRRRTISIGVKAKKVAIISDIHSNLEALNAVLEDIKKRGVTRILCLGDIIGYGPNPVECCELIQMLKIEIVQGNHDLNINLDNLEWFNSLAQEALIWTAKKLGIEHKQWLLELPKIFIGTILGKKIYMVHGSPRNPTYEYVMPGTRPDILRYYLNRTRADILITGHSHIPFVKKINKKLVINAGSVGQPRDGDYRACYILLDPRALKAEIIRVGYNIQGCAEKIYNSPLPNFLADRLFSGV